MNSVVVAGNLTRDPESKQVGEHSVTKFGIAVRRRFKSKGKDNAEADFFDVEVWGKPAEIVEQYLKKGSFTVIHGELKNESWEGSDGQKKYRTLIKADNVTLGPNPNGGGKKPADADENQGSDDNAPF